MRFCVSPCQRRVGDVFHLLSFLSAALGDIWSQTVRCEIPMQELEKKMKMKRNPSGRAARGFATKVQGSLVMASRPSGLAREARARCANCWLQIATPPRCVGIRRSFSAISLQNLAPFSAIFLQNLFKALAKKVSGVGVCGFDAMTPA